MPALIAGNTVVFKPAALHAAPGRPLRRDPRGGGAARRRGEPGPRRGRGGRRHLVEHPDVSLISFTGSRDRPMSANARRPPQARLAGDGRQERDHRDGRRRPRAGHRRHPLERLRHLRPALHRRLRVVVHREGLRRARGAAGGARRRMRLGNGLDDATDSARSSTGAARHDPLVRGDRSERGRRAAGGRRDRPRRRARTGLFHQPTISTMSSPECGSPRKRSSDR